MEINSVSQGRQDIAKIDNNINDTTAVEITQNTKKEIISENNKNEYVENRKVCEKDIKDMVEGLNKLVRDKATHIEYEKHEKFNEYVIKIINDKTKEVIKEIPPKKILDMVAKMCEMIGIIVDKKA